MGRRPGSGGRLDGRIGSARGAGRRWQCLGLSRRHDREQPIVATGSHIDSQNPGGRFDGALGVVAGILAVAALRERQGQPKRTIGVVSLVEEEASRFPTANFWGSRAIVGRVAPEEPRRLRGYDGVTMAEAMRDAGLDPLTSRKRVATTSRPSSSCTSSRVPISSARSPGRHRGADHRLPSIPRHLGGVG